MVASVQEFCVSDHECLGGEWNAITMENRHTPLPCPGSRAPCWTVGMSNERKTLLPQGYMDSQGCVWE